MSINLKLEIHSPKTADNIVKGLSSKEKSFLLGSLLRDKERRLLDCLADEKSDDENDVDCLKSIELEKFNINTDNRDIKQMPIKGLDNNVTIKINSEFDIFEFVDGVPDFLIGIQLFNMDSLKRESKKYGKKIFSSKKIEKIISDKYNGNYQKFIKEENLFLNGSFNREKFDIQNINEILLLVCSDFKFFYGDKNFGYPLSLDNNCFGIAVCEK